MKHKKYPNKKRRLWFVFTLSVLALICSCTSENTKIKDTLFQTSTFDALLSGNYEGTMSFEELSQKGDLGLGTFNELDGEMIALNGVFYQIKADGNVYPVDPQMKTPFAVVTHFNPDTSFHLNAPTSYDQFCELIDQLIPTKNIFYAIKIEGRFERITARSVPAQNKPFPPLIEVVQEQPLFEFNNEEGSMAGFRVPEYFSGINVPGHHYHFINITREKGGHILECMMSDVIVSIDFIHNIEISLNNTEEFYKLDLLKDRSAESEKVER